MIRPVSLSNNYFNFRGTNENRYDEPVKSKYKSVHDKRQDIKNGFVVGAMCGIILGTAGTSLYKDNQIDNLLKDMAAELTYTDSVMVEDMTEDSVPDIILERSNGDKTIYDLTSGSIYLNEDGRLHEKIQ